LPDNRILHQGAGGRPAPPRRALRGDPTPHAADPRPPDDDSAPIDPGPADTVPPAFESDPRQIEDAPIDSPAQERFADAPVAHAPQAPPPQAPPRQGTEAPNQTNPAALDAATGTSRRGGFSLLPHALPADLSAFLGRTVAATGLTPNMLTVLGLLGTGGAATLAAYGHFWQAGIVMLAAGAFDLLDGAVARATGRATTWGAIFDAVSDRLGEFAMFLGLLVWFSAPAHFNRDAVILIGVSIGGAMLVSYTRSKAGEYGVRIREGLGTRFERVVILSIGLFAGEVVAVLWILAVLTNLTALQRWGVTWWALRRHDAGDQAPPPQESPSPDEETPDAGTGPDAAGDGTRG